MIGERLVLAGLTVIAVSLTARTYQLDGNIAQVERELAAPTYRDIPARPMPVVTGRATWINPPELQAELDQLRARTEYLRIIAQILVAESDTKRVELPRPDPWVAWPAIVVPTERKAAR